MNRKDIFTNQEFIKGYAKGAADVVNLIREFFTPVQVQAFEQYLKDRREGPL